MTEYDCNSHHAHVCVSPEEGLKLRITGVSSILIRFCIFVLIIDDIALNKCGLILMYLSPKSLS